ncbi:hypothetical protein HCN56_18780, partial [Streptomyces lonarensis]|nr:hypothetical protein [Streptomyces lonarensis]
MTETGGFPERGQLDPAGVSPGHAAPPQGPVTTGYPFPGAGEPEDREEEELLMPGAAGAWGDGSATPPRGVAAGTATHLAGRHHARVATAPPRPAHLGPPMPEQNGAVMPLADRQAAAEAAAPAAPVEAPPTEVAEASPAEALGTETPADGAADPA